MRDLGSHTPPDILNVKMNFFQKVEIIIYQNCLQNSKITCQNPQSFKNCSIFHFTEKPWNIESPAYIENLQKYQRRKKCNFIFLKKKEKQTDIEAGIFLKKMEVLTRIISVTRYTNLKPKL